MTPSYAPPRRKCLRRHMTSISYADMTSTSYEEEAIYATHKTSLYV